MTASGKTAGETVARAASLPGLPAGVSSRRIANGNGLVVHVLEAGPENGPLLLLLHGFPELAYSWRKLMPLLAAAGYRVVAPDQRGYGLTTGWSAAYDDDLAPYRMTNLVADALGLVLALGRTHAAAVIGHDFGSPVAAWCGLIRPDAFRAVVMMSAPFAGPPALPREGPDEALHRALADLPRPRKHYQRYYATRAADADMRRAPQGLAAFLRAYYHVKSADWPDHRPHPLPGWTATALASLPTYYVMDRDRTMPETVAPFAPAPEAAATCGWLPDEELAVYVDSFARTGFQGGLNWYRCAVDHDIAGALALFAGRRIDVPATFVAGDADWGVHQFPGAFEAMATRATSDFRGATLIEGAGHWVQQERPEPTAAAILAFLEAARRREGDAP